MKEQIDKFLELLGEPNSTKEDVEKEAWILVETVQRIMINRFRNLNSIVEEKIIQKLAEEIK